MRHDSDNRTNPKASRRGLAGTTYARRDAFALGGAAKSEPHVAVVRDACLLYVRALLLVMLTSVSAFTQQYDVDVRDITENLQKRYNAMQDATAKFKQHVKFSFSQLEQTFEGTLTVKKPNRYRVESEHQTLVTDGAVVWAYSPVNKQLVIDRFKENQNSLSPEQFLLNLPTQYYSTLLAKETVGNVETYVLKLVPKEDDSFIKSVKMWVEAKGWTIRNVLIVDINDTETEYTITDVMFNTRVPNSLFSFTPPAGTEVVDLR